MNEKLGVEICTTPGEAPFSNGTVERNNKVLYESMMKTMDDCKCDMETALAWAVSAKNALQNQGGYSPNQLVFGTNVNLPSVITDLPPALESSVSSDVVRNKLNALHKARQNFIKAESSERIKRALRHNVRTYSEEVFEAGDKVFYRRRAFKGWKGPGIVLGKEGNFVLLRHGNAFYRCHPCHLMKVVKHGISESNTEGNGSLKKGTLKMENHHGEANLEIETNSDSEEEEVTQDAASHNYKSDENPERHSVDEENILSDFG